MPTKVIPQCRYASQTTKKIVLQSLYLYLAIKSTLRSLFIVMFVLLLYVYLFWRNQILAETEENSG